MTLDTFTGIAACTSGVLMALSPLLQARRVWVLRQSEEVSSGLFHCMRANSVLWILHGSVIHDPVLVVPNAVALLTASATLLVIRRFRHTGAPAAHAGRRRVAGTPAGGRCTPRSTAGSPAHPVAPRSPTSRPEEAESRAGAKKRRRGNAPPG